MRARRFLTIGGVWVADHKLFGRLESVDPVLLVINLLLLMAVAFLPSHRHPGAGTQLHG
jgi:uncharacterized membrane protein